MAQREQRGDVRLRAVLILLSAGCLLTFVTGLNPAGEACLILRRLTLSHSIKEEGRQETPSQHEVVEMERNKSFPRFGLLKGTDGRLSSHEVAFSTESISSDQEAFLEENTVLTIIINNK